MPQGQAVTQQMLQVTGSEVAPGEAIGPGGWSIYPTPKGTCSVAPDRCFYVKMRAPFTPFYKQRWGSGLYVKSCNLKILTLNSGLQTAQTLNRGHWEASLAHGLCHCPLCVAHPCVALLSVWGIGSALVDLLVVTLTHSPQN